MINGTKQRYLSVKEFAESYNLPTHWIYRTIKKGKLSAIQDPEEKNSKIFLNEQKALEEIEAMNVRREDKWVGYD